jgi:hypothetical protein
MNNPQNQPQQLVLPIPRWLNWRTGAFVSGAALLVAAAIFGVWWLQRGGDGPPLPPGGLYSSIKNVGRLTSIEYELSTVVRVKKPVPLWPDQEIVYGVCGRVTAGVDLQSLQAEDIVSQGGRVEVSLPAPRIFTEDLVLDNGMGDLPPYQPEGTNRTVQFKSACEQMIAWSGVPVLDSLDPELVRIAQEEALKAFHQTALDSHILETAALSAQQRMEDLLLTAGIENAVVRFRGSTVEPPAELP